jgi:oxygen-independent coproporphyrinogen-3 oxidase
MKIGIYVHIPFCISKCGYCSFVSRPWDESLADRYWRAVVCEMNDFAAARTRLADNVDSFFFGGGTPSVLPAEQIASIMEAARRIFAVSPRCEFSLEANPGTLAKEKLLIYRAIGVNRISLGVQSFADAELAAIGRIHGVAQIIESFALLRECGFDNVSLDLILGLPGQTERQWMANLERAVALRPNHLSVYMLELDPKLPLYRAMQSGKCRIPDEDAVADWYLQTLDFLQSHGYAQYEISNFALPGCECRHNLKYWLRKPVLAFGVAGHSHDGTARYANVASLETYLSRLEDGRSPVEWRESLGADREFEETLFLGLRLRCGLDWDAVRKRHRSDRIASCEAALQEMVAVGLVEWCDSRVRLTRRGMLLSNEVFQQFVRQDAIEDREGDQRRPRPICWRE